MFIQITVFSCINVLQNSTRALYINILKYNHLLTFDWKGSFTHKTVPTLRDWHVMILKISAVSVFPLHVLRMSMNRKSNKSSLETPIKELWNERNGRNCLILSLCIPVKYCWFVVHKFAHIISVRHIFELWATPTTFLPDSSPNHWVFKIPSSLLSSLLFASSPHF